LTTKEDDVIERIYTYIFQKKNNQEEKVIKFWDDGDDDDDHDHDKNKLIDDSLSVNFVVDKDYFCNLLKSNSAFFHQNSNTTMQMNNAYNYNIMSEYFSLPLLRYIVYDFPNEDHRFTSPKIYIIMALYRCECSGITNDNDNIQIKILKVLLESTIERVKRINEAHTLNSEYEIDINQNNYKWLGMGLDINPSLLICIGRYQNIKCKNNNIRDHDWCNLELMDYILSLERQFLKDNCNTNKKYHHELILNIIINFLRCYGATLGNNSETLEQPALLEMILKMFNKFLEIINLTDTSIEQSSRCLVMVLKYWPKSNFIREIGFIRTLECILVKSSPSCVKKALYKVIQNVNNSHFKICLTSIATLKNLLIVGLLSTSNDIVILVEKLRMNRSQHINPLVREQSQNLLDSLYAYLE